MMTSQAEDFLEQSAEKNIWACEGESDRRMENIA
jgi:hypothetical protein